LAELSAKKKEGGMKKERKKERKNLSMVFQGNYQGQVLLVLPFRQEGMGVRILKISL
jgi:hypothetical protein